jgi:hypothetical protein
MRAPAILVGLPQAHDGGQRSSLLAKADPHDKLHLTGSRPYGGAACSAPPNSMVGGAATMRYSHKLRKLSQPSIVLFASILLVFIGSIVALLSWSENLPFGAGWGLAVAVLGTIYLLYGCLFVFPHLVVRLDRIKEEASHDLHRIKLDSSQGTHASYLAEIRERLALENNVRTTLIQALLGIGILLGAALTWQQFIKTSQDLSVARDQLDLDRTTKVSEQFTRATELL